MKYVDEFRDPDKAQRVLGAIQRLEPRLARPGGAPLQLMEFCGGHTHTIFRYGLTQLLPDWLELVHGPGCPVCVLPMGRVDDCIALAERPEVILTSFGDALRVPGSRGSLLAARARGADVRIVYSPLDALALARDNPSREVVFFALGFETTMPSSALTLLAAERDGIENFSLFCNHITTLPTLKAILDSPDMSIDGFIAPGHVSMVIGAEPFGFVAERYARPIVITGFEPLDILQSIWMLLEQIASGSARVENQYARAVQERGNDVALESMARVFELREFFEWRGLGSIDHSGVKIRSAYARYDAERKFSVRHLKIADPKACQCGEVLKGALRPWECKVFGGACTPETPMGALMVSSEGACAAYYKFADVDELIQRRGRSKSKAETSTAETPGAEDAAQ
jgi:hydrogenase expression/formation protein HypD